MIDFQKKIRIRSGYTRLGDSNTELYGNRNGWDWQTSTGQRRSCRFYNDTLAVYLESVDGVDIDDWVIVKTGFSATYILRSTILKDGNGGWWDDAEKIDLCLMVNGDANIYEWNGAVAVVDSFTSAPGLIAVLATAPTVGGTSYTVGDVLTITTGDGTATAVVDAAPAGVVTAISILTRGSGYSTGTGIVTTGGTGTGATVAITTIGSGTVTKTGSQSFADSRFYTDRNEVFFDSRTGTEYTYVPGGSTLTLIIVTGDASTMQAGDVLIQKVVTSTDLPVAGNVNDTIANFENQIVIGSNVDNSVYASQNDDYHIFTPSSPRAPGEAFSVTLDNPTRGITTLGKSLVIGAGDSTMFRVTFNQLSIGTTITETVAVERLYTGVKQGFLNQESIIPVGDTIFYLSNEVALRSIDNPNNLTGLNPKTLSNPIKPDFDAEDWQNAFGTWYKNIIFLSAPAASHVYMLNFVEDADGKLFRFWNPPQVLPVGPFAIIQIDGVEQLYGHSNVVPETNLLFDGGSDGQYAGMPVEDKLPIEARALRAYNNYKKKGSLKNFDEYFSEGDITATTNLDAILRYDYGGMTQEVTETIVGNDETILEGVIGVNSLAQASLATNPLGGLLYPPTDARRYRVIFEEAKEDFFELQIEYYSNDVDQYWAILADGTNAQLSRRRSTNIKI